MSPSVLTLVVELLRKEGALSEILGAVLPLLNPDEVQKAKKDLEKIEKRQQDEMQKFYKAVRENDVSYLNRFYARRLKHLMR